MKPTVFIIGTSSHAYQAGEGAVFGETTCSPEKATLFRNLLIGIIDQYRIRAIGEELSIDALSEMKRTESISKMVADSRTPPLPHRYCDPSRAEQEKLGIRDEGAIKIGLMNGRSPGEIDQEIYAERRKREPLWLNQMKALSAWPTLFICGSWHVPSFSYLLREAGFHVTIVVDKWDVYPA